MTWTRWGQVQLVAEPGEVTHDFSEYILKAELMVLTDGLDVGCEQKVDPQTAT